MAEPRLRRGVAHGNAGHPRLASIAAMPLPLRRRLLWAAALAPLAAAGGAWASTADTVTLDQARADHEAGRALLIDIREPEEHASGVAAGARLLPMRQAADRLAAEIPKDPAQPVYLVCRTQNRSQALLRRLQAQGYMNVRAVEGGMSEWARRGWPLVVPTARP